MAVSALVFPLPRLLLTWIGCVFSPETMRGVRCKFRRGPNIDASSRGSLWEAKSPQEPARPISSPVPKIEPSPNPFPPPPPPPPSGPGKKKHPTGNTVVIRNYPESWNHLKTEDNGRAHEIPMDNYSFSNGSSVFTENEKKHGKKRGWSICKWKDRKIN